MDVKQQSLADRVPVVLVYTETGSWGSGVIINQLQGVVLTCSHVVKSESQGTIELFMYSCSLYSLYQLDLLILKIDLL